MPRHLFPLPLVPPLALNAVAAGAVGGAHHASFAADDVAVVHLGVALREFLADCRGGALPVVRITRRELCDAISAQTKLTLGKEDVILGVDVMPQVVRVAARELVEFLALIPREL